MKPSDLTPFFKPHNNGGICDNADQDLYAADQVADAIESAMTAARSAIMAHYPDNYEAWKKKVSDLRGEKP